MAGVGRKWTMALATAVLLMGAGRACLAQSAETASLSGRLTDLYSKPLVGVALLLRNQATGAEARATTTKNGSYRFNGLQPGEYTLEAESPQLGRGQVKDIVLSAGYEARVQTALEFEPLPPSPILTASQSPNRPAFHLPHLEIATLPSSEVTLPAEPLSLLPLSARPPAGASGKRPPARPEQVAEELDPEGGGGFNPRIKPEESTRALAPEGRILPIGPESRPLSAPPQAGPKSQNSTQIAAKDATSAPSAPTSVASNVSESRPALPATHENSATLPEPATSATTASELQALPISGRHWQSFVLDNTPTSATPAAGAAETAVRGAGQPPGIAVDGANRGLAFGSTGGQGQGSQGRSALGQGGDDPAGMARVGSGGHGFAVSEAAIRAVQAAVGNVAAAADRAASGRMNVETQRGSNELHGQGFLFDRQNTWGARNPFTKWVKETTPATAATVPAFTAEPYTPPDRETVWGIGLGSRIRRDKLFWFAALDGSERDDPAVATVKHPDEFFAQPTNDQMQVLSARLGLSSVNPVVEGLKAYSTMLETLAGLLGPAPRTATQWTGFGRLDWQAAERHRFTLEGIGARWNAPGGGLSRVSESYGSRSLGSSRASEQWLLGRWEAFLTPNLLFVTQGSAGRTILEARPETPSAFEQTLLTGNVWGQLPQIVVDSRYGFTIGNPSRFGQGSYPDEHLYQAQEMLSWVRGKLLVKAGFDVSHNADAVSLLRNQTGTYHYASVENFASDALAFAAFGLTDALNPADQHNCDETGRVWRDSSGALRGLGYLPCYSYYSQTLGPAAWRLSTNDWAGYATAQWQAGKLLAVSAGLRWEREQLPPPISSLSNTELPLTAKLPRLGNQWAPRVSLAVGSGEKHWPLLRLGYGMYFERTENATLQTALSQTGSLKGDLNFFMRPTDNLNGGGSPPFPYVLSGTPGSVVKPGAVEFAPGFRNPEIHQAVAAVEERLPGSLQVTASAILSLGRRLPISIDTNLDTPASTQTITYNVCDETLSTPNGTSCGHTGLGPIKAAQITVPFYASWPASEGSCPYYQPSGASLAGRPCPDYQQITNIMSRANSTYEAWMLKLARSSRRGLSLRAHYTYSHAMDWNPNESAQAAGNDVLDPADFSLEYGTSNLDIRHSAGGTAIYEAPWKLHGRAGALGNGWMLSGIWQFRSGLPYTMRVSGSLPEEFTSTGSAIVGLGPGMNGSGGDNRVYGLGSDNTVYNIGRNTFRYPSTWKADLRLGRRFDLGDTRQLELLAESFNLFNHQNVTELETTGYTIQSGSSSGALPTLNFLTGLKANTTAFGQPLNINATNFYRERQIELGLRIKF
jgi:hypothetical protein